MSSGSTRWSVWIAVREALARHVFPGVDAVHAGHRERGGLVDRDDARVGVRRVQHLQVQHAVDLGVHRVLGAAGDHVGGRGRADAGADGLAGRGLLDPDDAVDRILDRAIAGAAAEVSLQRARQVLLLLVGERRRGHDHARRCRSRTGSRGRRGTAAAADAGCPGEPRPSIVVTSRPSARNAGVMQLCTGSPSSHTVHAPQSPASQPFLTPWWPSERTNVRRHWPGTRLLVEGLAVDGVASCHAPPLSSTRISSAIVLRQVAAMVRGAVRVVEPHVRRVSHRCVCCSVSASGMVSKRNRTGRVVPAVTVSSRSLVSRICVADHEDRRAAQVRQREAAVGVPLAQGVDRDVDTPQDLARSRGCSRGCR